VAATCKTPLPTPSRALLRICATSSVGAPPDLLAEDVMSAIVSSRRLVLLRRQASKTSSRGDAPWCALAMRVYRDGRTRTYILVSHGCGIEWWLKL
jgi:hypothetical protein